MIALKRILLPTDFSRFSQPAVEMACMLADKFAAELHLLNVMDDLADRMPDFAMGIDLQPLRESWTSKQGDYEIDTLSKLSQVLDPEWKHDKHTTIATKTGRPFVEIVRYAREHEIDLIVMGTHGHTGLTHAMLGSVAENVVRVASCPVLTVRSVGYE